jgi:membrane protein required for colicin V production
MVVIDIIFTIVILLFAIRGGFRGIIDEVTVMASVVLGLAAAFFFHRKGALFLAETYFPDEKLLPEILAFLGLFLIVFLTVKLAGFLLRDVSSRIQLLNTADHVLGIFFGVLEGVVLVSLVLWVITIQPLFDPDALLKDSLYAETLRPFIGILGKQVLPLPGGGAEANHV